MDRRILFAEQSKDWAIFDLMPQQVHVTPRNDTIGHVLSICCECSPKIIIEGEGALLVNHNAIDGRILLEDLDDQLN